MQEKTSFSHRHPFVSFISGILLVVLVVISSWFLPLSFVSDSYNHYPNGETSVCITASGEKYHTASCSYLHSSSIRICLQEAVLNGYERCSRCDPQKLITVEDYLHAKQTQPIIISIILCLFEAALTTFFCVGLLFFIAIPKIPIFDGFPEWYFVMLLAVGFLTSLLQYCKLLIIW